MKFTIQMCSGCFRKVIFDETLSISDTTKQTCAQIQNILAAADPSAEWQIETTSCFRFCPENKISYSMMEPEKFPRGQMAMMPFSSLEKFPEEFARQIMKRKTYAP